MPFNALCGALSANNSSQRPEQRVLMVEESLIYFLLIKDNTTSYALNIDASFQCLCSNLTSRQFERQQLEGRWETKQLGQVMYILILVAWWDELQIKHPLILPRNMGCRIKKVRCEVNLQSKIVTVAIKKWDRKHSSNKLCFLEGQNPFKHDSFKKSVML